MGFPEPSMNEGWPKDLAQGVSSSARTAQGGDQRLAGRQDMARQERRRGCGVFPARGVKNRPMLVLGTLYAL
jgi:hypothetical protein